jgi:DNA-binding transcriptional MerR regulator
LGARVVAGANARQSKAGRAADRVAEPMHIGRLAALLQTTAKTIRHYERMELLRRPIRSASGYRMYDHAAIAQARLVFGLRRIGLSMGEVAELLRGRGPLRKRFAALLDEKIRDIDLTLGVMQGRREDLAGRQLALLASASRRTEDCLCEALSIPCHCAARP